MTAVFDAVAKDPPGRLHWAAVANPNALGWPAHDGKKNTTPLAVNEPLNVPVIV